jgi:hypothetical protein
MDNQLCKRYLLIKLNNFQFRSIVEQIPFGEHFFVPFMADIIYSIQDFHSSSYKLFGESQKYVDSSINNLYSIRVAKTSG